VKTPTQTKGRPRKRQPKPGERVSLGLRVTPNLKADLDGAAKVSGRSQSQEAELRLERSFLDQRLMLDALELTYGTGLAGIVLLLAEIMKSAGVSSGIAATGRREGGEEWWDVPYAFDQAARGVAVAIEALKPKGEINVPRGLRLTGEGIAAGLLSEVVSTDPATTVAIDRAPRLRKALGPRLVARLRKT
jgi:hypothetical protein